MSSNFSNLRPSRAASQSSRRQLSGFGPTPERNRAGGNQRVRRHLLRRFVRLLPDWRRPDRRQLVRTVRNARQDGDAIRVGRARPADRRRPKRRPCSGVRTFPAASELEHGPAGQRRAGIVRFLDRRARQVRDGRRHRDSRQRRKRSDRRFRRKRTDSRQ